MYKARSLVFVLFLVVRSTLGHSEEETTAKAKKATEAWTGRWFPENRTAAPPAAAPPKRNPMGVQNKCDDGKTNLSVDWFDDPINNTCLDNASDFTPAYSRKPLVVLDDIPLEYTAMHECMNITITYEDLIPTYGDHRPLWPKWGEYKFLPMQRWLHNLEHGGLAMLYHPCANKQEVRKLKALVTGCLYRHIITPNNLLSPERPLALVVWGSRLEMSAVSKEVVVDFIKTSALNGPEDIYKNGQYSHGLVKHAFVVSTIADKVLCPNL